MWEYNRYDSKIAMDIKESIKEMKFKRRFVECVLCEYFNFA